MVNRGESKRPECHSDLLHSNFFYQMDVWICRTVRKAKTNMIASRHCFNPLRAGRVVALPSFVYSSGESRRNVLKC